VKIRDLALAQGDEEHLRITLNEPLKKKKKIRGGL